MVIYFDPSFTLFGGAHKLKLSRGKTRLLEKERKLEKSEGI